mmetsp:Transcript_33780/g.41757  ORF Transcript_33780/g.41757 Transcript_33780/m.41757 type:complete len:83 (+) Transcript_33780:377-625(+)
MLVTKNAQIDKTGAFEGIFKNFFGNSFLFSKSDQRWKDKRKGVAHAFYKDKLVVMLDNLKEYVLRAQSKWLEQIKASPDGKT